MRPARPNLIGLARPQLDLFLRVPEEDPEAALQHVKRVLHLVVVVPGHLLRGTDLKLRDPEPRSLGVAGPALHLVEAARVLDRFVGAYRVRTLATFRPTATRQPRRRGARFRRAADSSRTGSPSRAGSR